MNSPYIKKHILQAIDHLRARKARPDLRRICNQLKRRHNCGNSETTKCLDHLLDMGIVIKVEYKGSASYRDASKWRRGHVAGHIINSNALIAKLQAAIDAIVSQRAECDSPDTPNGRTASGGKKNGKGATPEEIEAWLKKQTGDNACYLTGDALFEVLTREVEQETLKKSADDGTYTVGTRVKVTPRPKPQPSIAKTSPSQEVQPVTQDVSNEPQETASTSVDLKRQRPPSNRKRVKTYCGDIYELPPIKKSRKQNPLQITAAPASEQDTATVKVEEASEFRLATLFRVCNDEHQMETPSRHEGQDEEMLVCCGCRMKAHPDCLCYSPQLLSKINRETWRCVTCKKCAKCDLLLRTPTPMTCSGCDLAYHKSCHKPIMRKKPKDGWLCMKCTGREPKEEEQKPVLQRVDGGDMMPPADHPTYVHRAEVFIMAEQQPKLGTSEEKEEDSQDSIPPPVVKSAKDTPFPPTPRDSPSLDELDTTSAEMLGLRQLEDHDPQRVRRISIYDGHEFPDPAKWSVEQVYNFLKTLDGNTYAEGAEALKRSEVDGEALMYLTRADVVSGLSLQLGPALKLYRLIVNMRTNGNAHKYLYSS